MCGIAALISPRSASLEGSIQGMLDLVRHRGPNDEGIYSSDRIALGHRRLSIIDLSQAGHQPMTRGDLSLTYNGEIYNYLELRSELERLGYVFATQTDTEVVLSAYEEWGGGAFHRFNGMFALVIDDRRQNKVVAARDRFGIKPLYYWVSPDGTTAFASEIKQFTALPGWRAQLNGQMAYEYLNWKVLDHTDETLFDGVFQLRGGEQATVCLDRPQPMIERWYHLPEHRYQGSFREAAQEVRHLLTDAVRIRMRSDVSVGSSLSGGIDSSSIVCLTRQLCVQGEGGDCYKTFSACSDIPRFDERKFVERVVEETGVEPHFVVPSARDLLEQLEELVWIHDEPPPTASIFAQHQVCQKAKEEGIKVLLDGQGADEQLAGYSHFLGPHMADLFRSWRWGRLAGEAYRSGQRLGGPGRPILAMADHLLPQWMRSVLRKPLGRMTPYPSWIAMNQLGAAPSDPFQLGRGFHNHGRGHLLSTTLPQLLHWADRNSMAHSIEARLPFLDYRFVELVMSLPADYRWHYGVSKRVLRQAMNRIAPRDIIRRKDKMGFVTAEEVWVRKDQDGQFERLWNTAVNEMEGIVNPKIRRIWSDVKSGRRRYDGSIFQVIAFAAWLRRFEVNT